MFLALGISITAQGAAVVGYVVTRPTPRPTLTIHLGDAASSWDYDVIAREAGPTSSTTIKITSPCRSPKWAALIWKFSPTRITIGVINCTTTAPLQRIRPSGIV